VGVTGRVGRLQWRGWLLLADCAAVVSVAPWHRSGWSGAWFGVLAAALLCGPMFAWLVLARTRRWGTVVGIMMLGVLASTYLTSQVLLAGPVRPPIADWGIPFVLVAGAICVLSGAWQEYAVRRIRRVSMAVADAADGSRPRWPARLGAASLVAAAVLATWAAYEFALGDGAEPEAKVEPYRAEVFPLPSGWTVVDEERSCGSGGCYGMSLTLTGSGPAADPASELRRRLHDRGWSENCEPVGGLLHLFRFVDWGGHCIAVEVADSRTAKVVIRVRAGWPRGSF
jgi:hypothetical protein